MKKVFISLFLSLSLFLQLNCSKSVSNQNTFSPTPAASVETIPANTKVEATPLPTFSDAETAFAEGDRLFDANEIEMAIEAYKQAVSLNPDFGEAYFKLGISYAIIEKQEETIPLGAQTEEESPTPAPKAKSKNKKEEEPVRTKKSEKAFENAVKVYKKFLAKNPKEDAAQFYLGRSYDKLNEDADALKAFREAVKLKPNNSEYQTELGKILIKLAQYDEAVRILKKALELDSDNLLAEEQLEYAEDGRKRIDFAKRENQKQEDKNKQTVEVPKQKANTSATPNEASSPIKPANANK
jgi:tetratricopeptide (TPR) repeat protein